MFVAVLVVAMWQAPGEWSPALQQLLVTLVANGQRYAQALPSLNCEEQIISQRVKAGKVVEEVTINGSVQVARTGNDIKPFTETHATTSRVRNGAIQPESKRLNLPYYVVGAFANGLSFNSMERLHCFNISLEDNAESSTMKLNMLRKPGVDSVPACAEIAPGARRTALIDRASGHVVRIERINPPEEARKRRQVDYGIIQYASVELGSERFWLPVQAEMRDSRNEGRMQAHYSACKRYAGTLKIMDGIETVPQ